MVLWVLAVALVILGFVGVLLPAIPGVPLVFAGLLVAAWADGFERVGWVPLTILAVLTAVSVVVDLAAGTLGPRRIGASRWALVGAAVGTLIGLFFGLVGVLLGPFAGALVGELAAGRGLREAGRAGVATWVGIIVGTAAKLALAAAMVAVFAAAYAL